MWIDLFLVLIGGIFGTLLRYGIAKGMEKSYSGDYPIGTLIANFLGCFFAGILFKFPAGLSQSWKYGVTCLSVGFCGSLTTFSSYVHSNLDNLEKSNILYGLIDVLVSTIGCFLMFASGVKIYEVFFEDFLKHQVGQNTDEHRQLDTQQNDSPAEEL